MPLSVVSEQPATFDDFWKVYPRRVAKGAARIMFRRALEMTTAEALISGARAYAKWCADNVEHQKYIAHPATWLNPKNERWEDEYTDDVAAVLEEMFK